MTRKAVVIGAMVATLVATSLRAARLPNDFATEHWLIDYRFGFVKRGLIGSILSLASAVLHTRPTDHAIDMLSVVAFLVFCAALIFVCIRMLHRTRWSSDISLAALVFLSSPFIVMSAHLIGYYDNIVVTLAIVSLALVFQDRIGAAAIVQSLSLLIHENTLLIAFPVVVYAAFLTGRSPSRRRRMLPLLVPIATFALVLIRQTTAPRRLEPRLTHYLETYPFVVRRLGDVRVPHWITVGFYPSYLLQRGHIEERLLSQSMIALVLPSMLGLIGALFAEEQFAAVSVRSAIVLAICLVPQSMHVMVFDTARTWTYSIVCAFLLLWITVETRRVPPPPSQFVRLVALAALFANAITATPLMDGLQEHFDVTTRVWMYAPLFAAGLLLARQSLPRATGEPDRPLVT